MSFKEKLRIENIHKKAQRILNEWKQTIVSQQVDQLLLALFPKSPFLKKIVEKTKDYTTNTIKNHHSFSELNITKTDIIKKLIEKKIIPEISNNLKTAV
jgi:dGTP triphosphohydrolase